VLMGVFYALTTWTGVHYLIASLLAWAVSLAVSFALQRRWTFGRTGPGAARQLVLYLALLAANIAINQLLLWLLVEWAHLDARLAQLGLLALISTWNFVIMRQVIFRPPTPLRSRP
jgi:putative flippase GtrA